MITDENKLRSNSKVCHQTLPLIIAYQSNRLIIGKNYTKNCASDEHSKDKPPLTTRMTLGRRMYSQGHLVHFFQQYKASRYDFKFELTFIRLLNSFPRVATEKIDDLCFVTFGGLNCWELRIVFSQLLFSLISIYSGKASNTCMQTRLKLKIAKTEWNLRWKVFFNYFYFRSSWTRN